MTLHDVLRSGGGSSLEDAARLLVKQAIGAYLNARHPGVEYPRTASSIVSSTNSALASADRDTMLGLQGALDADNNSGCPLN